MLLPDYLHCLWRLPEGDADYSVRWAKIKRLTRHHLGMTVREKLWQPRYWEHSIRDESDFARPADYQLEPGEARFGKMRGGLALLD